MTDEEVELILDMGVETRFGEPVRSLKALLAEDWDAIFVGCGAPRGAISTSRAATRRRPTSISASIGCRASRSAMSTRSAAASSCSAAATPRWIAAALRAGLAAKRSPLSCAAVLRR